MPVPDQRREQMLQAAVEVICERGFSDTRIADVAKRTGASPALVIYYFGTKDGLLTAAFRYSEDQFYSRTADVLEQLGTAAARLETLVRLTCVREGAGEDPGAWGLWFDLWAQAFRHPEVARDRVESDQRWRDTIARVVRDGQRTGEFAELDVLEFAVTFSALLDGLSIQVALSDPEVDSDRATAIAMRFASDALGFEWAAPTRRGRYAAKRRR
ncbi:TetR/AcrR family transcriptional regulator [Cryptosporangium aurantiacum]|uniref:TetR/AcrR family transcriptional regulator n=1 Tax=Cryptosporangium aurantiacum TaxID=134849 RepID=UPI00093481ED|nr:TetR family transcriptional regulator C-terminal domain-containing protein [Cryptosporangium aurantiacum]